MFFFFFNISTNNTIIQYRPIKPAPFPKNDINSNKCDEALAPQNADNGVVQMVKHEFVHPTEFVVWNLCKILWICLFAVNRKTEKKRLRKYLLYFVFFSKIHRIYVLLEIV